MPPPAQNSDVTQFPSDKAILEKTKPKQCEDGDPDDCIKEWESARKTCRELIFEQMEQAAGRRERRSVTGVTGGYTDVEQCARGLVSERCGGNKVNY